ncbi:MAG: zinc-dependent metalloprotease, partial [Acidimicrobiaceae bacterium]|nr:zinc-dependent metalloprotease [Acidimicrobiaceae bacterium]
MTEPINWETAAKVADRLAARQPPVADYERRALEADFTELTAQAEELVQAETGLRSLAGPARARVADRRQWVEANVASFRRLLRPVTDRIGEQLDQQGRRVVVPLAASQHVA